MAANTHLSSGDDTQAIPKSFAWAWLALLLAASVYIRLHGASDYHLSNDEAMVFNVAGGASLSEVARLSLYEVHPPLFYMLLHCWMAISTDPAFVRGFSLLMGTLTILLFYRIGSFAGGGFTGLCAAAIVAFSPGWITQSYVVRQYATFIFFLSCAFYSYLIWRERRSTSSLLTYLACACIACLMHFSGILGIFCIAAYEGMFLLRERRWKTVFLWGLINLPPALLTLAAYYFCLPTIAAVKAYVDASGFDPHMHATHMGWKALPFYPLNVTFYLFSTPLITLVMLVLCPVAGIKTPALRPLLTLSAFVLGLGAVLCATQTYGIVSARHDMWTFPFLTLTAAAALSDLITRYGRKYVQANSFPLYPVAAVFLFTAGCLLYDSNARFADLFEYQVPQKQWESLSRTLDTLGPTDLIVANRDDAILLKDTYPYLDGASSSASVVMPLGHTHVLMSPLHRRFYRGDLLAGMLSDARTRGLLNGINRLVFYQTQWALMLDPDLTLCPVKGKQVIALKQSNPYSDLKPRKHNLNYAILTLMPADKFLALLSPTGTLHGCLRGQHDPLYVAPPKDY